MILDLDSAIQHCEEVAKDYDDSIGTEAGSMYSLIHDKNCMKCAEEYRQLADWLKLLKRILESGDCNDCALLNSQCRYAPRWGEQVRYNCPFYSKESSAKKNNGLTKFSNTKWG